MTFEDYEKTVPSFVPKGSIHWIMGNVHVGTSDAEVEADIRRRLAKNKNVPEDQIVECVKYALACHKENRELYRAVMSGRF